MEGYPWVRRWGGLPRARRSSSPVAHHRKKTLHLAAAALAQRCEFGTLRRSHADTVDDNVVDLIEPVTRSQPPLDFDRPAARWTNDLTSHNCTFGTGATAGHFERLTVRRCKSLTVDAHDIIFEELAKLLLFGLACDTPIRSEHKPGHAWNVEILLQHW